MMLCVHLESPSRVIYLQIYLNRTLAEINIERPLITKYFPYTGLQDKYRSLKTQSYLRLMTIDSVRPSVVDKV